MTTQADTVVRLDLGCTPELAISGALLVQTETSTFLTFNAMTIAEDGFRHEVGTALVEFSYCHITKFGYPSEDAISGHPLYLKMEEAIGESDVFEVLNSSWKTQLEEQNRILFPDYSDWAARHFIITFRGSTFECLADNIYLTISQEPYKAVFQRIAQRVLAE